MTGAGGGRVALLGLIGLVWVSAVGSGLRRLARTAEGLEPSDAGPSVPTGAPRRAGPRPRPRLSGA